ncbi:MAG: type II toxin-antitoxin system RelE/ParE family toxin [Proteobacteria bacterium]|nr:type II toxin-antitoxin system RelE/ParE family toxin [Pseudomonadota bacterium]
MPAFCLFKGNVPFYALGDRASVGDGVFELREHFGSGYRIYYGMEKQTVILLLCGGDKSSQMKDINLAKQYW